MKIIEIEAAVLGNSEKEREFVRIFEETTWSQIRKSTFDSIKHRYKSMSWFLKDWRFPWDQKQKKNSDVERKLKLADQIFPKHIKLR